MVADDVAVFGLFVELVGQWVEYFHIGSKQTWLRLSPHTHGIANFEHAL